MRSTEARTLVRDPEECGEGFSVLALSRSVFIYIPTVWRHNAPRKLGLSADQPRFSGRQPPRVCSSPRPPQRAAAICQFSVVLQSPASSLKPQPKPRPGSGYLSIPMLRCGRQVSGRRLVGEASLSLSDGHKRAYTSARTMLLRDRVPWVDPQPKLCAVLKLTPEIGTLHSPDAMSSLERITSALSVRDLRDPQRGGLF